MKRTLAGVMATLALSTTMSCASSPPPGPVTDERPLAPVSIEEPGFRSPVDAFRLPEAQMVEIQRLHAQLLRACLAEHGVESDFVGDYLRPPGEVLWGGPLGTRTAAKAATAGYKARQGEPFALGPGFYLRSVNNIQPLSAAPEVTAALAGTPQEPGCFETVDRSVGVGPVPEDVLDAERDAHKRALARPEVAPRIAEWRSCMADRGHVFADVWEPGSDYSLAPLSATERDVAVADAECAASSRWPDWFYAALEVEERQEIDRNRAQFTEFARALERRLDALRAAARPRA